MRRYFEKGKLLIEIAYFKKECFQFLIHWGNYQIIFIHWYKGKGIKLIKPLVK